MAEIHKLVNCNGDKEELPDQWQECIILPVYRKGNKNDCSNYHKISNILIS
jgi:hypothetical protein